MSGFESVHDFERPPVNEVVVGIQFAPLPLTFVHAGLFATKMQSVYPKQQVVPPLPAAVERFDGPGPAPQTEFAFQLGTGPADEWGGGRVWLISPNETRLLQLQPDRLLVNWRSRPGVTEYPRYGAVRQMFADAYAALRDFTNSQQLGEPLPVQCEVSYFNHIQAPDGSFERPDRVFKWWSAASATDTELPGRPEALAFRHRRRLLTTSGEPYGRLFVNATPATLPTRERVYQVELTVRGAPLGPGLDGVQRFHDLSREVIVRTFTLMTTEEMHSVWRRVA